MKRILTALSLPPPSPAQRWQVRRPRKRVGAGVGVSVVLQSEPLSAAHWRRRTTIHTGTMAIMRRIPIRRPACGAMYGRAMLGFAPASDHRSRKPREGKRVRRFPWRKRLALAKRGDFRHLTSAKE